MGRAPKKPKDPNKPKRAMSAYFHFLQFCREEAQRDGRAFNKIAEFSKECAERWKGMGPEDKIPFDKLAGVDKARYDQAMAVFKPARDPEKPKKPASAYFLFLADFREKVKTDGSELTHRDVLKHAGEQWNKLTDEEKAPYQLSANAEKVIYDARMATYNLTHDKPPPAPRKRDSQQQQQRKEQAAAARQAQQQQAAGQHPGVTLPPFEQFRAETEALVKCESSTRDDQLRRSPEVDHENGALFSSSLLGGGQLPQTTISLNQLRSTSPSSPTKPLSHPQLPQAQAHALLHSNHNQQFAHPSVSSASFYPNATTNNQMWYAAQMAQQPLFQQQAFQAAGLNLGQQYNPQFQQQFGQVNQSMNEQLMQQQATASHMYAQMMSAGEPLAKQPHLG